MEKEIRARLQLLLKKLDQTKNTIGHELMDKETELTDREKEIFSNWFQSIESALSILEGMM